MANEQNLKPFGTLAENVQRDIRSKGGKARAQKIKKQKTMAEALRKMLFDVKLSDAEKEQLKAAGIEDVEDFNNQMMITRGLMKKAKEGDVQAYNAICAMIGEKPADKLDLHGGMSNELHITHITKSADDKQFPSSEAEVEA